MWWALKSPQIKKGGCNWARIEERSAAREEFG
jgi:hypothetical protein